jgi:luciferase-like monooxygenase
MKIGFSLPNIGPIGTAEALTKVAQRAETLGYNSLWTIERLLWPVKLQRPYPGTPDGSLPEVYRHTLDPLDSLTYVAAQTKKIKLGTSVLDVPYYNPVMLARRLTTIDLLSNGRLCVGLGLGWNKDELDATGADISKRGALADEFLPLLKAIWTTNPVEFHGKFFHLPKSYIDAKPVQKTASADLPRRIRPESAQTSCKIGRRMEPGLSSRSHHGGNVRQHQANGEGSRPRSIRYFYDHSCGPWAHRETAGQGPGIILRFP